MLIILTHKNGERIAVRLPKLRMLSKKKRRKRPKR